MIRLGGGWQGRGNSRALYSGPVSRQELEAALAELEGDQLRILVLANDRRQTERSPDVAFFLAIPLPAPGDVAVVPAAPPAPPAPPAPSAPPAPAPPAASPRRSYTPRQPRRTADEYQR